MVDLLQLFSDTSEYVAYFLLPPLALGVLFLLAWDRPLGGEPMGFGKRTFLLLVFGGTIGWLANIPFVIYRGSILAVNVGGAFLPVVVSVLVLGTRLLPGRWKELGIFLAVFAFEVAAALVLLVTVAPRFDSGTILAVFLVGGLAAVALRPVLLGTPARDAADLVGVLGLTGVCAWGTYLATQVIPGVGIGSAFPAYVIAPVALGLAAVPLRWPRRDAPALAFATSTLGVLVGADVLHQPQLFAAPTFLGSIGGAGLLDLVFLSGPLALMVALGTDLLVRRLRRGSGDVPVPSDVTGVTSSDLPRLGSHFQPAFLALSSGHTAEVPSTVLHVVDREIASTRRALGLGPVAPEGGLDGLSVHPFVHADLANLRALAATPSPPIEDVRRSLVAGLLFERAMLELLSRRLAPLGRRFLAYALDLVLVMLPSALLFALVLHVVGGLGASSAATSVAYNGAISAVGAWPFLFFVVCEATWGATPGKRLFGLSVLTADATELTWMGAIARNVPKLLPLAALSITLGLAVPYALYSSPAIVGQVLAGSLIALGAVVVGVFGFFSVWAIRATARHQRFGDLLAGTMVVVRTPAPLTPEGAPVAAPRPTAPPMATGWHPPPG